jgi:hypothetical protein
MRRHVVYFLGLLGLAGCSHDLMPSETPISVRTVPGNYQDFAACAYQRLEQGNSATYLAQMPSTRATRIYSQAQIGGGVTVRGWDMTVRQAGPDRTEVSIKAFNALLYPAETAARDVWERIGSCVRPA